MYKKIKNHLDKNNFTYLEHFKFAAHNALLLVFSGFVLIIHALLPFAFTKTAFNIIKKINKNFEDKNVK